MTAPVFVSVSLAIGGSLSHVPALTVCSFLLHRLALILMVFVNYGGGKYWYFKHASWNGTLFPKGSVAEVGPLQRTVGRRATQRSPRSQR